MPFDLPPDLRSTDEGDARESTPRWARIGLLLLLLTTAGTYLYNLAASGYGNSFYAAAVEAGSKSWKAMFFGSLDASNFITVDKPPAALWVMDLSARLFGFSTWSVMVPGVLEGVAAVALLYGAVRRVSNHTTGLVAGALLAATPVAALMFRFDNPDALLVLLLVGAAYCMTRAIERAGTRWILAVGALLGFAFLTKMMQAFTVVPAFGLAYLIAAPTSLRRRVGQLSGAMVTMVIAGGWWVAIVALTPAADRPFVDGSPDNSILNLIFDYNGFGRLPDREPEVAPTSAAPPGSSASSMTSWGAGLLAAPGSADGNGRRVGGPTQGAAHGPAAGISCDLGRMVDRHGSRVQLRQGRHPHLLHGRIGARDRWHWWRSGPTSSGRNAIGSGLERSATVGRCDSSVGLGAP